MAFEQKPNTGTLFINDRKTTENHPDRAGTINVGGTEYWLNGWIKTDKKGRQYLSLAVKAKQAASAKPEAKAEVPEDFQDDDIPF